VKFNLRKPFAVICAAILALSVVSSASAADPSPASPVSYNVVALGDSISVGYEPGMTLDSIPYGYVDRLFEQSLFYNRSELFNYAIMGLTTSGLGHLLQGAADKKPLKSTDLQDFSTFQERVTQQADIIAAQTPQLAVDLAKADLVFLTIGANDFTPIINAVKDQSADSVQQIIQDSYRKTMNDYTENLDKLITQLHELAPRAQIVLADQYLPLWDPLPYYTDLLEVVQKLATELDVFAKMINAKGIPLNIAHVSSKFVNNEKKFTHFNVIENFDIHPSQSGYEAIAQTFAEVIWGKYLKPAPRAADTPLSIVINGKEPPSKPVTINNTTFLALRDVAEAVDADLKWIQKTKTAVFTKNGQEVIITIGADTILVNGVAQHLDTPAYFQQVGKIQKTYVPLAVISKGLDYQVIYRKSLVTAFINS